jgi:hypothetical protein
MMKKILFLVIFLLTLAACAQPTALRTTAGEASTQPAAPPTPTPSDQFVVTAWVDNPYPKSGERINISGSLQKNGTYLGGMMMSAYWPDEDDDRLPDCHIQVIYQRGICIVYAENFPVGEYTPIKISFDYFGQVFTGETGFTRQE